jgi:hypothetical protein
LTEPPTLTDAATQARAAAEQHRADAAAADTLAERLLDRAEQMGHARDESGDDWMRGTVTRRRSDAARRLGLPE